MQQIWFHGTTRKKADSILKTGFREGTWFARHMEDAVTFGGPVVFSVKVIFRKPKMKWQVCCSNPLPTSTIESIHLVRKTRLTKKA